MGPLLSQPKSLSGNTYGVEHKSESTYSLRGGWTGRKLYLTIRGQVRILGGLLASLYLRHRLCELMELITKYMEKFGSVLKKRQQQELEWNFKCRRQELIQQFVDRINQSRMGTKYKPVSAQQLNCRYLWTMSTRDLEVFYKRCLEYGNFSKCFFGSFKRKPTSN